MGEWTLLSNHGHVLVCLFNNNQARLRDVAAEVSITERAVQNILRELQNSGLVQVNKHGRCNHYQINTHKSLRHPLEAHCTVGQLLQLLKAGEGEGSAVPSATVQKRTPSKPRAAAKPHKAESATATEHAIARPDAATSPRPIAAEVPAPIAPSKTVAAAVSQQADSKPAQGVQGKKAPSEIKPAKKDSNPEKKNKLPSDQQGSLF